MRYGMKVEGSVNRRPAGQTIGGIGFAAGDSVLAGLLEDLLASAAFNGAGDLVTGYVANPTLVGVDGNGVTELVEVNGDGSWIKTDTPSEQPGFTNNGRLSALTYNGTQMLKPHADMITNLNAAGTGGLTVVLICTGNPTDATSRTYVRLDNMSGDRLQIQKNSSNRLTAEIQRDSSSAAATDNTQNDPAGTALLRAVAGGNGTGNCELYLGEDNTSGSAMATGNMTFNADDSGLGARNNSGSLLLGSVCSLYGMMVYSSVKSGAALATIRSAWETYLDLSLVIA